MINFTKKFKFNEEGNHIIRIDLYENLDMNYMFKNLDNLVSVEMNSNNNCQILSMISNF